MVGRVCWNRLKLLIYRGVSIYRIRPSKKSFWWSWTDGVAGNFYLPGPGVRFIIRFIWTPFGVSAFNYVSKASRINLKIGQNRFNIILYGLKTFLLWCCLANSISQMPHQPNTNSLHRGYNAATTTPNARVHQICARRFCRRSRLCRHLSSGLTL